MNCSSFAHSFHVPVMGIGFSIDTPLKLAHFGISSVVSLVDDGLMESLRETYSRRFNLPFEPIHSRSEDARARRITAYLDFLNQRVAENVAKLHASVGQAGGLFEKYMAMLPDCSVLRKKFSEALQNGFSSEWVRWFKEHLPVGSIDVNNMTKLDVENYREGEKLPVEYNDAHAALRGFAQSEVEAGVVLSAGLNPRLYSYFEHFSDFYPDEAGRLRKKIILKTSDYRSAYIQGKFFAKKGLWVSEFRVESGLNCGGHAFGSEGNLLGPILEEFHLQREGLQETLREMWLAALRERNRPVPAQLPVVRVTAQGGVGTSDEHEFLLNRFGLDSVGWGTPFLLVPEVVNVDEPTLALLENAGEDDLYLSDISPLGVPFNSVRGNSQDVEKEALALAGKPGSSCPKRYARLNLDYAGKPICTASRSFQQRKISEIVESEMSPEDKSVATLKVVDKACLCIGLGVSALIVNDKPEAKHPGVSICPGPNLAYFSRRASLVEMTDHIYGRTNLISHPDRPHFLLKELELNLNFFLNRLRELKLSSVADGDKSLKVFRRNLEKGIAWCRDLFQSEELFGASERERHLSRLEGLECQLPA